MAKLSWREVWYDMSEHERKLAFVEWRKVLTDCAFAFAAVGIAASFFGSCAAWGIYAPPRPPDTTTLRCSASTQVVVAEIKDAFDPPYSAVVICRPRMNDEARVHVGDFRYRDSHGSGTRSGIEVPPRANP